MDLSSGVSLGTLVCTLIGVILTGGIAWGALLQRVKTLEKEVTALSGFDKRLTTIEQQSIYIAKEVDKITSSWLFRDPVGYEAIDRPVGSPATRTRRTK